MKGSVLGSLWGGTQTLALQQQNILAEMVRLREFIKSCIFVDQADRGCSIASWRKETGSNNNNHNHNNKIDTFVNLRETLLVSPHHFSSIRRWNRKNTFVHLNFQNCMKSCSRCAPALAGSKVSTFPFLCHGIFGEMLNSLVSMFQLWGTLYQAWAWQTQCQHVFSPFSSPLLKIVSLHS